MITIREETMRDVEAREALLDACFGPTGSRRPANACAKAALPARGPVPRDRARQEPHRHRAPVARFRRCEPPGADARARSPSIRPCQRPRPRREADARGACRAQAHSVTRRSCWWAMLPITSASASRRKAPPAVAARSLSSASAFSALELEAGALDGARGLVSATGAFEPKPDLAALVAAASQRQPGAFSLAA